MSHRFLIVLAVVALLTGVASADELRTLPDDTADEHFKVELDRSYLWDGGALPFVYGSLAVALGFDLFVEPPDTPRFFPASEGGAHISGDTVPEFAVVLYALGGGSLVGALPDSARWHHLKGYGEAVATTLALTEIAKNVVGRHRPSYQEGNDADVDLRRSFFSGHASLTAASTVYLGIYLGDHILPRLHGGGGSLIKAATWTTLGGILVGVPLTRVNDNRHHVSDVLTGAFVGSACAVAFYTYQESRYDDEREGFYHRKRNRMVLLPDVQNRGLALLTRW